MTTEERDDGKIQQWGERSSAEPEAIQRERIKAQSEHGKRQFSALALTACAGFAFFVADRQWPPAPNGVSGIEVFKLLLPLVTYYMGRNYKE